MRLTLGTTRRRRFVTPCHVPVLSEFDSRAKCSEAYVHRPRFAGIDGNRRIGTLSIVLSGNYEDDEDWGDTIIYTGAGGKKKWTDKVHIKDQSWNGRYNAALRTSYNIENSIRVIRSSQPHSPYAPSNGYRYDGLYRITERWTAKGVSGFGVCRCRLERLPDQPPIPLRPGHFAPVAPPNLDGLIKDSAIDDDDDIHWF